MKSYLCHNINISFHVFGVTAMVKKAQAKQNTVSDNDIKTLVVVQKYFAFELYLCYNFLYLFFFLFAPLLFYEPKCKRIHLVTHSYKY